jgi:hypothetical protein
METTLVPKGMQRDEGGEEARVMPRVYGQDPSYCGKTGGDTQKSIFCMHPEVFRAWRAAGMEGR